MESQIIITIIGVVGSGVSGFFGWFAGKKRSKADTDSVQIDNLMKQLEFYKTLVTDYKKQLEEYIEISEQTRLELLKLRKTVGTIVVDVCVDKSCTKRMFLSDITIQNYFNNLANKKEDKKQESDQ